MLKGNYLMKSKSIVGNGSFFSVIYYILLAFCFLLSVSCSSAPKRPAAIYTDRNTANNLLDQAIRAGNQSRYEDALVILEDARLLAVSTDDPQLLIKTSISRGNFLFSLGSHDEAFGEWNDAVTEAERSGESNLACLARIYIARGNLMRLINSGSKNGITEIRDQAAVLVSSVKSEPLVQAAGYSVIGLAEKELGRYADAEKSVRQALDIHAKSLYLEDAAYDWYIIASIFSVAGRYDDALKALDTAIEYDRRAENSFGLASSWMARGDVCQKAGSSAESASAYKRAAGILRAMGLEDAAANAEAKIKIAGF